MSTFSREDARRYAGLPPEEDIDWVMSPIGPLPVKRDRMGSIDFDPFGGSGGIGPQRIPSPPPAPIPPGPPAPAQPKGFMGRLKQALPGMIQGGIDAAATPNIAGGGPVDIFRAVQGAGNMARARDIQQQQMARQAAMDEIARRKAAADIDQSIVQTDMYRSAAEENRAQAAAAADKPFVIPAGSLVIGRDGKILVDNRKGEDSKPVILGEGQKLVKEVNGEVKTIAEGNPKPTAPAKPTAAQTATEKTEAEMAIRKKYAAANPKAFWSPEAEAQFVLTGRIPPKPKPEKSESKEPPRGTPAQFAQLERTKNSDIAKAKAAAQAAANDLGVTEAKKAQIWEAYKDQVDLIQESYENQIEALGGSVTSRPRQGRTPVGIVRPAGAPKARTASEYMNGRFGGR